jgi:hypothetical protein
MAQVDLPRGHPGVWLFLVLKLKNLKFKMYQEKSHKTPHIHIDYGRKSHVASYSIRQAKRLAGNLDRKYDRVVKEWITENRERLLDVWANTQVGEDPVHIIAEISGGD